MKNKSFCKALAMIPVSILIAGCNTDSSSEEAASIEEQLDYTITGIEAGSGTSELAEDTIDDYDNLNGWNVHTSSTAGMVTSLDLAIQNEEPIIVTAWTPHWIFEEYDLKFLDDPLNSLGAEEFIHTIAREGLAEDMPNAYEVLDRFEWALADMQEVMLEAQDIPFEQAAANWVENNRDKVDVWTEGIDSVEGEAFSLVSTPWDTERSSSHVMEIVLEELGYEVSITNVDPVVMFQAVAHSEADASLSPWLPDTFGAFYAEYEDQIDDLGPNMSGALNGLVVPAYMDIDSIEDLQPRE